ncbi:MAG: hypothetical protein Q8N87_01445 [bacterium]|nr:hypothetical protein [bacterium]
MRKKKEPKWKPTYKFWVGARGNLKTGKWKDKYIKAKTPEQEKVFEEFDVERTKTFWKIIWGDKYDWAVKNLIALKEKYGAKKVAEVLSKAIKKVKKGQK